MRELIYEHAGGIADGRELKAVIPGGSSVPALTPDQIDVPLDYDSLGAIGTFFGAASLIVVDDRCCMVQLALRSTKFYMHESCGKCTPCRVGTRWMVQILESIENGTATRADLDLLDTSATTSSARCCARSASSPSTRSRATSTSGATSSWPTSSGGGCPFGGSSSLEGILAPSDQHAHAPPAEAARMSAELVRVTIDERDVHVPKGTGIVETALAAGIEIPVFCYEPRLGAPVGACRMCLVEVEGDAEAPDRLHADSADGMVVKTARTSEKAAQGQNGTLEFILVNHPLDCPVCDKGGECPLQDLTFRYGPGNTRMSFEKQTFEKPIPISPTISLDRERCILCYRCTRFSSERRARTASSSPPNRGAMSVITTFEDLPYTGAFTGNVTELCPVGALLPTQYRFEGRPWEIVDVPTVCGLCPVGCNIHATVREAKVKRILSRNHPEIDEGWICDKGRFAFTHLRADDRLAAAAAARRLHGLEPVSWEDAIDEAERLLRKARGPHRHRALRLRDGRAGVRARQAPARRARLAPGDAAGGGLRRARRLPAAALGDSRRRRRRRPRRRAGRRARARRRPLDQVRAAQRRPDRRRRDDPAVGEAERVVLVWSGPGGHGGATVAKLAEELGLAEREGCGAFYLPETPNGRGVADAWAACCDEEARSRRIRSASSSSPVTRLRRTTTSARSPSRPRRRS